MIYYVKKGDTLFGIALQHKVRYVSLTTTAAVPLLHLSRIQQLQMVNSVNENIFPGQCLKIPFNQHNSRHSNPQLGELIIPTPTSNDLTDLTDAELQEIAAFEEESKFSEE